LQENRLNKFFNWIKQLAEIGDKPSDTEDQRLHHRFLIYVALLMNGGGLVWGSICLYNGLLIPAIIPFGYIFFTIANLWYFYFSKRFKVVRFFQILLSLVLPFFFQWSLGGFTPSGTVFLWSMTAMLGALTFQEVRITMYWFLTYLLLTVLSGLIDGEVSKYAPSLSSATITFLFVVNIMGVSIIVFGLMQYFVRSRELTHAELELKNKELIESQTQLIKSEKMASVGLLTAGITHEINNPIGVINSTIDVFNRCITNIREVLETGQSLDEIRSSTKLQRSLKALQDNSIANSDSSKRISKIVNSLKSFTRLDEAELQKIDLHESIESTLILLGHDLPKGIRVVKEYGTLPALTCYPGELNQVFLNLLKNAAEAIDGEGTITIRTLLKANNIQVQIADTGVGMSQEQMHSLFEPSFTKSESRVKAGLGLYICYNIIQKHQGEIKGESKEGKGSTFEIMLPTNLEKQLQVSQS
jgi:signal transduction histidine kinase